MDESLGDASHDERHGVPAVIMGAAFVLLTVSLENLVEDRDVLFLLESLMFAEVRMSDPVDCEDNSHVRISDLCALYVAEGGDRIGTYLTDVLDSFSGSSPYKPELTFGENTKALRTKTTFHGRCSSRPFR